MKAACTPADPARLVKDHLAGLGYHAVLMVPQRWESSDDPVVLVADDGGTPMWPVATEQQVRVTVLAAGRTTSRDLAGKCLARLLADRITGISAVRPGASLSDSRDTSTAAHLAGFTVRVIARTSTL